MEYLPLSFLAGILTILAPCVLPTLPIIITGSIDHSEDRWRPYIITASLAFSLVVVALLIKGSTALFYVDDMVWRILSVLILVTYGVITLFPRLWDTLSLRFGLSTASAQLLQKSSRHNGWIRSVLIGFSLGPVYSSCSPTYLAILSFILPQSFFVGVINLVVYALGLSVVMLFLGLSGQTIISKVRWATDPHGWFKKVLGILFIALGLMIGLSGDKAFGTLLQQNNIPTLSNFEQQLLDSIQ